MCLTDKGVEIQVTDGLRDQLVARHNAIRAAVSPPASSMQKLVRHFRYSCQIYD